MRRLRERRIALRESALLVCEGDAEAALLRVVREGFTAGRAGRHLTIRNAHGKGAGHVVDTAIGLRRYGAFSIVAALLDTDTDWNQRVEARARRGGVQVLRSDPCLEATLLQLVGISVVGDQRACKERFRREFGGAAHEEGLIAARFTPDLIVRSRPDVLFVDQLLTIVGV